MIKNYKEQLYDHLALADQFDFAEDAQSATFRLREGIKFHDGSPVTPDDVKWSYEHYHGAWAQVLHDETDQVKIVDKRTVRFHFKEPFLDFPRLMGTANVCGAGWVVPAKYYEKVGQGRVCRRSRSAPGPTSSSPRSRALSSISRPSTTTTRPCTLRSSRLSACPMPATRVAMIERGEADIIYFIPGELIARIQSDPKIMLAPVVSGNWWLEFPGFQDPKKPVPRQAGARGDQPGDRPRCDEQCRMRRARPGRRQLDQRRR